MASFKQHTTHAPISSQLARNFHHTTAPPALCPRPPGAYVSPTARVHPGRVFMCFYRPRGRLIIHFFTKAALFVFLVIELKNLCSSRALLRASLILKVYLE